MSRRPSILTDFIRSANEGHGADAGAAVLLFLMIVAFGLFAVIATTLL